MRRGYGTLRLAAGGLLALGLLGLGGCGAGEPLLTQQESYDIVECSLAGWGTRSLPRKICERQGGLSLTPEPYRGPGPYNAPTIEERRAQERPAT